MDTWALTGFSKYPKSGSPDIYKDIGSNFKKKGAQVGTNPSSPKKSWNQKNEDKLQKNFI